MLSSRYLRNAAEPAVNLYGDLQTRIQEDIARRIAGANYATETAKWQREKLRELGASRAEINKAIAELTGKDAETIKNMFGDAGAASLKVESKLATAAGVDPRLVPDIRDKALASIVKDAALTTRGTLAGLTKTAAQDATRKLNKFLDDAYMDVASGAFTTEQAVKNAVSRFAKEGVTAFDYKSGRAVKIEGAVRTAVRTGVSQMSGRITLAVGKEVGLDTYRVTSHADSRPDHAEWQGGIYSEEELRTVCGLGEADGLKGVNCRHDFYLYKRGVSEPPEAQDDYDPALYEAEQAQRNIERNIRAWKREAETLKAGGQDATAAERKVRNWQEAQRNLLKATKEKTGVDLARLYERERIASSAAGRAVARTPRVVPPPPTPPSAPIAAPIVPTPPPVVPVVQPEAVAFSLPATTARMTPKVDTLTGIDPALRPLIKERIEKNLSDFPIPSTAGIETLRVKPGNATGSYGLYDPRVYDRGKVKIKNQLEFNKVVYKSEGTLLATRRANKQIDGLKTAKSNIDHEFAHVVDVTSQYSIDPSLLVDLKKAEALNGRSRASLNWDESLLLSRVEHNRFNSRKMSDVIVENMATRRGLTPAQFIKSSEVYKNFGDGACNKMEFMSEAFAIARSGLPLTDIQKEFFEEFKAAYKSIFTATETAK
jgi:hypothetical protein